MVSRFKPRLLMKAKFANYRIAFAVWSVCYFLRINWLSNLAGKWVNKAEIDSLIYSLEQVKARS